MNILPIHPINLTTKDIIYYHGETIVKSPFMEFEYGSDKNGQIEKYFPQQSENLEELEFVSNLGEIITNLKSLENFRDYSGKTILHLAIENYDLARFKLILLLLPHLIDTPSYEGITPLLHAVSQEPACEEMCHLMINDSPFKLKMRANLLDKIPGENFSVGHIVVFTGKTHLAKLFFERAPFLKKCPDAYGLTPADWALYQYHHYLERCHNQMDSHDCHMAHKFRELAIAYAGKELLSIEEIRSKTLGVIFHKN